MVTENSVTTVQTIFDEEITVITLPGCESVSLISVVKLETESIEIIHVSRIKFPNVILKNAGDLQCVAEFLTPPLHALACRKTQFSVATVTSG
jgi:hypothetical protein